MLKTIYFALLSVLNRIWSRCLGKCIKLSYRVNGNRTKKCFKGNTLKTKNDCHTSNIQHAWRTRHPKKYTKTLLTYIINQKN